MLPNFHRRSPVLITCLALAGLPITGSGEAEEKAIWFGDIASPENLAPVAARIVHAGVRLGGPRSQSFEIRLELLSEHVPVVRGDHDRSPAAFAVKHQHPVIPPQGVPPNFRFSLESL